MLDSSAIYEVTDFVLGTTKTGTKMGTLNLRNTSDNTVLNCKIWEEALNRIDPKNFRTGSLIRIKNGSLNEKYNNYIVNEVELVKEAKMGMSEEQREEVFSKILEYANKIQKQDLREFILSLLNKYNKEFKTAPAAKAMHHNYIGGLTEHTYECLKIADTVLSTFYKKVDADIVYAACILHDFGKIHEYNFDLETGIISYNNDFIKDWISHSQWAFTVCMSKGYKDIAKMVAAHHGRTEWGAIIDLDTKDLEPFVYLIHHIDDLSAKFGKTSVNDLE